MGKDTYISFYDNLSKLINQGMEPSKAIAQVRREFDLTGPAVQTDAEGNRTLAEHPTGEQLQQALNAYLPQLREEWPAYAPRQFTPEEMAQRYEYSGRCRDILMKLAEEQVQLDMIFHATAKRLFEKDFGENVRKRVAPRRWISKLIKAGDSDEVRYHNEEVVALAMLGESYNDNDVVAGRQRFKDARYKHYTEDLGYSAEEATQAAERELENGMERLKQLTIQAMDEGCPTPELADQARDAILTGTADKKFPGGLEGAYRTLMNPGSAIAWNINNITHDFEAFGMAITPEEYKRTYRPYEMNSCTAQASVAQMVANPYYAILDAAALINIQANGLKEKTGENADFSALSSFGINMATGLGAEETTAPLKYLPRFALTRENCGGVRGALHNVNIFSNGRGRTVIFWGDPVSIENGVKAPVHTDKPGRLLSTAGYAGKITQLREMSTAQDRFLHSSWKYRSLKSALKALPREIPDNISRKEAVKLERKFKELQKAAEAYLERKTRQFAERDATKPKDPYEQTRYDFAMEVKTFTEDMANHVKYIREHTETMKAVLDAERAEEKLRRKGRPIVGDPALTPFQRKMKPEDDRIAEEARRAAEQKRLEEEQKKERQRREEEELADAGDVIEQTISDAEKEVDPEVMKNAPKERPREMGSKLTAATEQAQKAYEDALTAGNAEKANEYARDLIAAKAVWAMIQASYTFSPEMGGKFHAIAEGGQSKALMENMKASKTFTEKLAGVDLSNRETFDKVAGPVANKAGQNAVASLKESRKRAYRLKKDRSLNNGNPTAAKGADQNVVQAGGNQNVIKTQ